MSEHYGRIGLDRSLAPPIAAAEGGFVVTPRVAPDWNAYADRLRRHAPAAQQYLPGGQAPKAGQHHANPALARTLRAIARDGGSAFHEGAIAADIAATIAAEGGTLSESDPAGYRPEDSTPIVAAHRDRTLVECPPNGQDLAALMLARMIETFDVAEMGEADRIDLLAEAAKAGFRPRNLIVADPASMRVCVKKTLSDRAIRAMRDGVAMDRAGEPAEVDIPLHPDTAYLAVVDADGNAVSLINSNFPASGDLLQSRGEGFLLVDGNRNVIAPGRRSFHTTLLRKSADGQGFPFPGGTYPTASVMGMPSAVWPFRAAMRTWSSAT